MAEAAHRDEPFPPNGNAWFFKETSLEQLLQGVQSLTSIDELAIDDLSPEEASSFLRAIEE